MRSACQPFHALAMSGSQGKAQHPLPQQSAIAGGLAHHGKGRASQTRIPCIHSCIWEKPVEYPTQMLSFVVQGPPDGCCPSSRPSCSRSSGCNARAFPRGTYPGYLHYSCPRKRRPRQSVTMQQQPESGHCNGGLLVGSCSLRRDHGKPRMTCQPASTWLGRHALTAASRGANCCSARRWLWDLPTSAAPLATKEPCLEYLPALLMKL